MLYKILDVHNVYRMLTECSQDVQRTFFRMLTECSKNILQDASQSFRMFKEHSSGHTVQT